MSTTRPATPQTAHPGLTRWATASTMRLSVFPLELDREEIP
ncbi:hypothetical protein FM104_11510 [Microbacterium esteraromaticum]|uniref:Uncharacterized protein n=1 Tax=Microbacterium esteraromaticum TaxID=57043 RepID=A0A1R4KC79_9MICO|nr:hypothetical protein FM104_11510 [Microbacterium esteraromaticum]